MSEAVFFVRHNPLSKRLCQLRNPLHTSSFAPMRWITSSVNSVVDMPPPRSVVALPEKTASKADS